MRLKRANVEVIADDASKIRELKSAGFVPVDDTEAEPAEAPAAEDLDGMTVKELRAMAKARGLELSKTLKKQDLIEVLTNDRDTETETTPAAENTD